MSITWWLETLGQDLRLALRLLRRTPAFAVVVVLTLGLGIGANAAIFGVVNSLLLRPLPVVEPDRLATISVDSDMGRRFPAGVGWTFAMWERMLPHVARFDAVMAWTAARFDLAQGGEMQPVNGLFASGSYFTTLGVHAILGRTFTTTDDQPGGGADGPVAVISYSLWQRRFDGAASVIGSRLVVDGVPVTIVGVTPPEFLGVEIGRALEVALPLTIEPLIHPDRSVVRSNSPYLAVMLRLTRDQSIDAGTAIVRTLQPQILGVTPETLSTARPARLRDPFMLYSAAAGTSGSNPFVMGLRQSYQRPLITMFIVVAIVLLIACVNIANLLLARATARRHEFSVRLALGAPRARLARQLLIESLLLASAGALVGLLFASWGSRALIAQLSTSVDSISMNLTLDWRVVTFTIVVALVTAALFGTAPAFRASRAAPMEVIKAHGRTVSQRAAGATGGGWRGRGVLNLSGGLVVGQVALALTLVVVAGLFVRTFAQLTRVPLGFDRDRVLVVNVDMRRAHVDPANRLAFSQRLVEAVRQAPGVAHAGASMWTPVDRGLRMADPRRRLAFNFVSPGWFAAYGTTIRAGRDIDARDTAEAPPVVIVNDTYVRTFLPDRSPIGELVTSPGPRGGPPVQRTIIGVVDDAVFDSQREGTQPMAYLPLAQTPGMEPPGQQSINISLRPAAGSPMGLARGVGAALTAIDPGLAFSFRAMAEQIDASVTQERVVARLSGVFGVLALLLAALGLYGVTSYAVNRRSTEIGIRMALGAQRGDVLTLVLGQSLALTAIGIALGLVAAATVTRYLRVMLFGLTPLDPMTFVGVAAIFAIVAATAAWIPAHRATKVDPLVALRCD